MNRGMLGAVAIAAMLLVMERELPAEEFDMPFEARILMDGDDLAAKYGLDLKDKTSQDYNSAGFELYERRLYHNAALLFRCATIQDPDYALPHYNLSCALSLARAAGEATELDEILAELETSIKLDSARLAKAKKDGDFDSIRGTQGFQDLVAFFEVAELATTLRFKDVNDFIGDPALYFTDPATGEELSFGYFKMDVFSLGFYQYKTMPDGTISDVGPDPTKVGKIYRVRYRVERMSTAYSGRTWFNRVVTRIEPVGR